MSRRASHRFLCLAAPLLAALALPACFRPVDELPAVKAAPKAPAPALPFDASKWTVRPHVQGGGAIACPVDVDPGDAATCSITPARGYRLVDVAVDGVSVGGVRAYTFRGASGDRTITAIFAREDSASTSS